MERSGRAAARRVSDERRAAGRLLTFPQKRTKSGDVAASPAPFLGSQRIGTAALAAPPLDKMLDPIAVKGHPTTRKRL